MSRGVALAEQLRELARTTGKKERLLLLNKGGRDLHHIIREISHNILKGNVHLKPRDKRTLKRYRDSVRSLALKKTPLKTRLSILLKHKFLPALINPVLHKLPSVYK